MLGSLEARLLLGPRLRRSLLLLGPCGGRGFLGVRGFLRGGGRLLGLLVRLFVVGRDLGRPLLVVLRRLLRRGFLLPLLGVLLLLHLLDPLEVRREAPEVEVALLLLVLQVHLRLPRVVSGLLLRL